MDLNGKFIEYLENYVESLSKLKDVPDRIKGYNKQRYETVLYHLKRDDKSTTRLRVALCGEDSYFPLFEIKGYSPGDMSFLIKLTCFFHTYSCVGDHNYENFCCVVDDLAKIKIVDGYDIEKIDDFFKKIHLELLMSYHSYKDMPNLRKYMINAIKNLDSKALEDAYNVWRTIRLPVYIPHENIDWEYQRQVFDARIKSIMENGKEKTFYSELLLMNKDRFFYINEKLDEIESNEEIKKEIFSYIRKILVVKMFEELNVNSKKDSFVECMDIVFDSDSYHELFNKLNALLHAQNQYMHGDKKGAFTTIGNLNDSEYKEVRLGREVSYPNNTMNRVVKPKTIIGRMKDLYSRIDDSISYDFMDVVHDVASGYEDYNDLFKSWEKEALKPLNKVKYKLKSLFKI